MNDIEDEVRHLSDSDVDEILAENSIQLEPEHEEIPKNSDTLLMDESTSRFSSAVWYEAIQKKKILVAGVGGIGSYVVFLLARMHPEQLIIMDNDVVEYANMSGQLYSNDNVNSYKTEAIAGMVANYANYYCVSCINRRFDYSTTPMDIMICGFDNMSARSTFFNSWVEHVKHSSHPEKCLFIDGRLAAEEFQVLCIQGNDTYNINRYREEFLFGDTEADATVCSYKQTTFCANMIASVMINLFTNFVANECNPLIPRDLPFFSRYDASTMFFKTEA